jgi:hypothetical protein
MSIFEHGKEELIAEIARRQDQIIRSNKSNVRVLGEVASQRLRDQIANNVCKEVLPANTEEYTGTLPMGTRFHRRIRNTTFLVVEQPPTKRTILITPDVAVSSDTWGKRGMKPLRAYTVPFPYVVFVFRFKWFEGDDGRYFDEPTCWVCYRKEPLRSENSSLYHTNLSNVDAHDCTICMGETLDQFKREDFADINKYADKYLGRFWGRGFTTDLQNNYQELAQKYPDHFSTIRKWQVAGNRNANFVLDDIDYRYCKTVKDFWEMVYRSAHADVVKECKELVHATIAEEWEKLDEKIRNALEGTLLSRAFFERNLLRVWKTAAEKIEERIKGEDHPLARPRTLDEAIQ